MDSLTIYVLILSIIVQLTAAALALRLIRRTGELAAWWFIAVAITLMAVRRSVTFSRLFEENSSFRLDPSAEIIALVISVLMALGIGRIGPFFFSIKRSEEKAKLASKALQESETRLTIALEAASEAWWEWNFKTGKTIYSPSYYQMLGYEPDEFPSNYEEWRKRIHPDDIERTETFIKRHLIEKKCDYHGLEFRMLTKDNRWRWLSGNGKIVERNAQGEPVRLIGTNLDIDERKKTDEELRKSKEIVERIFSLTPACIAYMDRDFNFIRVNKEFALADGKTPEYFIGKNYFHLYPNAENEAIFRQVVETGDQYVARAKPFEYKDHPERGVSHWDWSLTPVKDPAGRVEAVILSLVNVTEGIRAQEELARLNEELEERVASRTAELEKKTSELERLNRLFVGRELRMAELKKRIKELENR